MDTTPDLTTYRTALDAARALDYPEHVARRVAWLACRLPEWRVRRPRWRRRVDTRPQPAQE